MKPYEAAQTVQALGPEIALDANAILNIGMALHELIINAMRFGSTEGEGISVTWKISSAADGNPVEFELSWSEPALQYADLLAQDEGFGRLVLCRLVPSALSGHAAWSLADGRVVWRLTAPLSRIQVGLRDPFSE
nr:hypothetical protein [Agrobacterium tumefaciens]